MNRYSWKLEVLKNVRWNSSILSFFLKKTYEALNGVQGEVQRRNEIGEEEMIHVHDIRTQEGKTAGNTE